MFSPGCVVTSLPSAVAVTFRLPAFRAYFSAGLTVRVTVSPSAAVCGSGVTAPLVISAIVTS